MSDPAVASDAPPRDLIKEATAEGGTTRVQRPDHPDMFKAKDPASPGPATFTATPKQSRMRSDTTFNKLPAISDDDAGSARFDALPPGQRFIGPSGQLQQKPWQVTNDADFDKVPEGEYFRGPDGELRTKPKYEGVDLTTQTLYDMTANASERRKVLARQYGNDAVKEDHHGDLYVEGEDGKRLKPGRGLQAVGGFIGSSAAPVAGAIAGEALAGPLGAAGGAVAGQHLINDAILGLAGVYDRSLGEEVLEAGGTAALTGGGSAAGRLATGTAGATVAAPGDLRAAGPTIKRLITSYLGADVDKDATQRAMRLQQKGVLVPPSAWLKEAPYLRTVSEVFDPTFRQQRPLQQSATEHYETEANRILQDLGVTRSEPLTAVTKPVSAEAAGEKLLAKATSDLAEKDVVLQKAMDAAKASHQARLTGSSTDHASRLTALREAHQQALDAAQNIVNEGFRSIESDVVAAGQAVKAGASPGDLIRSSEKKIRSVERAIKMRAGIQYEAADAAAGSARPTLEYFEKDGTARSLTEASKDFLGQLPKAFQDKYPDIVKRIQDMKPGETTFSQLRHLRSLIRSDIDYGDLLPSVRDGAYRRFAGLLDNVLHNQSTPELKEAVRILDATDKFYAKNISKFKNDKVKWIVDAVVDGMPPDAAKMASQIMTKDQSEQISGIRKLLGPGLWNAIQHADTQSMIDSARTTVAGEIDGQKFVDQVVKRVQDGIIKNGYSRELSEKVLQQANRIKALTGKMPVQVAMDDTLTSVMEKVNRLAQEIETSAKIDPLGSLDRDMRKIEGQYGKRRNQMLRDMRADPLSFIYKAGASPAKAADRIIGDPDLFVAAAKKFGPNSPEFEMLRQVAAERMFQTASPGGILGKLAGKGMPESVQALVFPGVTRDEAVGLAKDMEFLLGGPSGEMFGSSQAAQGRVLHPTSSVIGSKLIPNIPVVTAGARAALGAYYKFITNSVNAPWLRKIVVDGLKGTDAERIQAKQMFQKWAKVGGYVGAGGSQMLEEGLPNE